MREAPSTLRGAVAVTACPLCNHPYSRSFPIFYTFEGNEFEARRCRACSFIFIHPRPTENELALLYSDEYFLHDGADCGAHAPTDYETAARKGSVKFPEILGWIKKFKPRGDFFEVGCGMGYFLDYARSQGYTVSGIEYAALGAKACREKFGLDVQQASFEAYPLSRERYDVIFMGDVLEHLNQPLEMVKKAQAMLKSGGVLAVEVPSMFNSLVGRIAISVYALLGVRKKMPMPPYHVNEFVSTTLKQMLERAGFSKTLVIQRIKAPFTITLRGSWYEKVGKQALQYPNYVLTKLTGRYGDRLLGIGIKEA